MDLTHLTAAVFLVASSWWSFGGTKERAAQVQATPNLLSSAVVIARPERNESQLNGGRVYSGQPCFDSTSFDEIDAFPRLHVSALGTHRNERMRASAWHKGLLERLTDAEEEAMALASAVTTCEARVAAHLEERTRMALTAATSEATCQQRHLEDEAAIAAAQAERALLVQRLHVVEEAARTNERDARAEAAAIRARANAQVEEAKMEAEAAKVEAALVKARWKAAEANATEAIEQAVAAARLVMAEKEEAQGTNMVGSLDTLWPQPLVAVLVITCGLLVVLAATVATTMASRVKAVVAIEAVCVRTAAKDRALVTEMVACDNARDETEASVDGGSVQGTSALEPSENRVQGTSALEPSENRVQGTSALQPSENRVQGTSALQPREDDEMDAATAGLAAAMDAELLVDARAARMTDDSEHEMAAASETATALAGVVIRTAPKMDEAVEAGTGERRAPSANTLQLSPSMVPPLSFDLPSETEPVETNAMASAGTMASADTMASAGTMASADTMASASVVIEAATGQAPDATPGAATDPATDPAMEPKRNGGVATSGAANAANEADDTTIYNPRTTPTVTDRTTASAPSAVPTVTTPLLAPSSVATPSVATSSVATPLVAIPPARSPRDELPVHGHPRDEPPVHSHPRDELPVHDHPCDEPPVHRYPREKAGSTSLEQEIIAARAASFGSAPEPRRRRLSGAPPRFSEIE